PGPIVAAAARGAWHALRGDGRHSFRAPGNAEGGAAPGARALPAGAAGRGSAAVSAPVSLACARARAGLQARLDADPAQRVDAAELEAHLAGCADCRAFAHELQEVQDALRAAPLLRFPDEALEAVWDRTVRARQVTGLRRGVAIW